MRTREAHGSVKLAGSRNCRVWRGRYYRTFISRYGNQVRKQIWVRLGLESEMTKQQADVAMMEIIKRNERDAAACITFIGTVNSPVGELPHSGGPRSSAGAFAELVACADLLRRGFEVFRAVNPLATFDLVTLKNNSWSRVEVKYGKVAPDGRPICEYKSQIGRFDMLAVVDKSGQVHYFDGAINRAFIEPPVSQTDNASQVDVSATN